MCSNPRILSGIATVLAFAGYMFAIIANAAEPPPVGSKAEAADSVRIALPSEVTAAVGVECNIYFDNILLALNSANFAFDVNCPKGRQQSERWTWTPTDADIGDVAWELDVRDSNNRLVSRAQTTVKVFPANTKVDRPLSLLLIGDSLTHASVYSQQLLDLSSKQGASWLSLIGSHGPEPTLAANRHEGYGGWTAFRFATHYNENARKGDYSLRGSPFLYKLDDGSTKLEFQRYCDDVNQGKLPDAVAIFLGPNDIFSFNDETIANGIDKMLIHFDQLIEMIKTASPSTRVGIMLPVPPAATQDAFGSNYGSGQTRWQYRRNQHSLVEAMIKCCADHKSKGVDLIATHVNLDCQHNYPSETVVANSHADQKIVRQSNGVHPSAAGYRQIGDSVFAWLMSLR